MDKLTTFYEEYLRYVRAKDEYTATVYDKYIGISGALRAKIIDNWIATQKKNLLQNVKRFYYVSLEYNFDSPVKTHISSGGLEEEFEYLKKKANLSEDEFFSAELILELGNSLIGDYSTHVLETLATCGIPAVSYGLWYRMAQFKQSPNVLGQVEMPYHWDYLQHPWIVSRPEYSYPVFFGGRAIYDSAAPSWIPDDMVKASSMDYPVSGCGNGVVNTARFWKAVPSTEFPSDYQLHNDYSRACNDEADTVKFMLNLPVDEPSRQTGEHNIKQQYFLASATVKDIIRRHINFQKNSIRDIADKAIICLADCRCGFVIVEFVRVLTYDYAIDIKEAVKIAKKIFVSFLPLPEGGDMLKCPVYVVESLLPLHAKVIMDMNHIILEEARSLHSVSDDEAREISLIEEGTIRKIRMANLLLLFSKPVFGFSENAAEHLKHGYCKVPAKVFDIDIRSDILGISVRRWLFHINKKLSSLISSKIGDTWITDNSKLLGFEKFAKDVLVQNEFEKIKNRAKEKFSQSMSGGFYEDLMPTPRALFIVQSRRISIANSQIMTLLYIACRYIRLCNGEDLLPRVYLFAGRALPNDFYGKRLVTLLSIFSLALRDNQKLQLHFIHNDNATVREKFLAMGDMTEYISLPSVTEAIGFNIYTCASNGLITLTGANVSDINAAAKLGSNTTFGFENVSERQEEYKVSSLLEQTPILQKAFDLVYKWVRDFSGSEEEEHRLYPFLSNLRDIDDSQSLMYFDEYYKVQEKVDSAYINRSEWLSMSLRNVARVGGLSLDKVFNSLYHGTKESKKC